MACIELFHYLRNLLLAYDQWSEVYRHFSSELEKAHSKNDWTNATIKCTPSSIYRFPTNVEFVKCLGVSLSRYIGCFMLTLNGKPEEAQTTNETFDIPEELHLTAEDNYFDAVVDFLSNFARKNEANNLFLPLGVTYKMPISIEAKLENTVLRLDKAFRQAGPERDEVNLLLTVALMKNLGLETCKVVLVNQTSALLIAGIGLVDPNCRLVVTEYGAAYIDAVDNLELLTNEQKRKGTHTIMELDWSEFADGGILNDLLNKFDKIGTNKRIFEKMIAARYRCEKFQMIVLQLVKDNVVFPDHADRLNFIKILNDEGLFDIHDLEKIEEDECPEFEETRKFIGRVFQINNATIDDCFKIRYISVSLAKRAAQMIAVILSSWINRRNENNIVVGLDERLYRIYSRYAIINDIMFMLVRPLLHYKIVCISEDVGVAAALTAGMSVNHYPIPY